MKDRKSEQTQWKEAKGQSRTNATWQLCMTHERNMFHNFLWKLNWKFKNVFSKAQQNRRFPFMNIFSRFGRVIHWNWTWATKNNAKENERPIHSAGKKKFISTKLSVSVNISHCDSGKSYENYDNGHTGILNALPSVYRNQCDGKKEDKKERTERTQEGHKQKKKKKWRGRGNKYRKRINSINHIRVQRAQHSTCQHVLFIYLFIIFGFFFSVHTIMLECFELRFWVFFFPSYSCAHLQYRVAWTMHNSDFYFLFSFRVIHSILQWKYKNNQEYRHYAHHQ